MPTISKKQYDDYKQLCKERDEGRILTPDGLRFICEAYNYDPEAIGKHMLEDEDRRVVFLARHSFLWAPAPGREPH